MGRSEIRIADTAVLFAAGAAQAADLVTSVRLMPERGTGAELNPVVRAGASDLGLLPLVVAKLSLIVLVVAVFTTLVRTQTRLAFTVATAATTAGMIGAFSNVPRSDVRLSRDARRVDSRPHTRAMTRDDRSIEQLATAWLAAERGVEAEPQSERIETIAQDLAAEYEDAVRRASIEELRLAWEAAQAIQRDCLIGTAEWAEARRVAVLLRGEYLARRG